MKRDTSRYARYLDALRKVLAEGATAEDFRERLQLELDPQVNEKRKLFCEIMEGSLSQEEREAKEAELHRVNGGSSGYVQCRVFCRHGPGTK